MTNTAYIVLQLRRAPGAEPEEAWLQVEDGVNAVSASAAIRDVASRQHDAGGTYVAVPTRSWKPVSVRAEQTTTIKLGEAT